MARLPSLEDFNLERQDLLKIKTTNDNTVLMSKAELREVLIDYIDKELDLISSGVTRRRVNEIIEDVDKRLNKFEITLEKHINDKINEITERVIEKSTTNLIEERVNHRLMEKIKSLL
jgi:flagellar biosynthesis/type III secretory pathway protein FliH